MTPDCKEYLEFWQQDSRKAEDVIQRICELHYEGKDKGNGVSFDCRHRHDAVNYTLNGEVELDGKSYRFTIRDGNWDGTVVEEWGTEETVGLYTPPPPPMFDMVPVDDSLESRRPHMWQVYLAWKKEPWFKEIIKSYAYDSHFAPGLKTEQYWRGKAAQKGLKIVQVESEVTR